MKLFSTLLMLVAFSASAADDHAVVLVYHHVSEKTPALTSVTPAAFDSHLEYLQENDYRVWPLARIVETLRNGDPLPKNTVAITFDDAYQSIYSEAFPRLQKRGWPFTVFVSSEGVDRGYAEYLDWPRLRELANAGVELGNHSHSHAHLVRYLQNETRAEWQQRIRSDIDTAAQRIESETGSKSTLFAYPYGEHSADLKALLQAAGYTGIAQQSGAVGAKSDFLALPRFPMSRSYSNLQRFATAVASRPLVVESVTAKGSKSADYQPLQALQLTLEKGGYRESQLACYRATGKRLPVSIQMEEPLTISIEIEGPQNPGRHKINCTAPANEGGGVFYWYSFQWLIQKADGSWYQE